MNRNDGAVGDARKRAAEFDQALDQTRTEYREALDRLGDTRAQTDVAQIAHALTCIRCRMDWYCGGLCDDDYENAGRIADLLARVIADAKAEAWDEGNLSGGKWGTTQPYPVDVDPPSSNPYRAEATR